MKSLFLIFTLIFSIQSFGETSADQSQMIKDGKCIPHRDSNTGNITKYICDKNEVTLTKNGNFERIGVQKMQKLELKKAVDREDSLVNKIKSCLSAIYAIQVKHHKEKSTYTSSNDEFILNNSALCSEIDVTAEIANQSEFRVIAKSGNKSWSVNQRKELIQLR